MGKLDHVVRALQERQNPKPPRIEMTLVDDGSSAELTRHIDDLGDSVLKSIAQVLEQIQTAATRDSLESLVTAISGIRIPTPPPPPAPDLTPILKAIEKLAEAQQKPREWKFKIKRNGVGGISEVVATAE